MRVLVVKGSFSSATSARLIDTRRRRRTPRPPRPPVAPTSRDAASSIRPIGRAAGTAAFLPTAGISNLLSAASLHAFQL